MLTVNPTSTGSPAGASSPVPAKSGPSSEQFLQLLVAQLAHQDPLNPMDNSQLTSQLAQLSSLEQLSDVNNNLVSIGAMQESLVNAQALGLLGKTVLVSGIDQMKVQSGVAEEAYAEVPAGAATAMAIIKDAAGHVVRTIDLATTPGRQAIAWDGKDSSGTTVADGKYTISIEAKGAQGGLIDAGLLLAVRIDGVSLAGGMKLTSDGREVPFDQITEIQAR